MNEFWRRYYRTFPQDFRDTLVRKWREGNRSVLWIMQNPSYADASLDDPTVALITKISVWNGYDRLNVVNGYPRRATLPSELYAWLGKVHAEDLTAFRDHALSVILAEAAFADCVVAAWGVCKQDPWYEQIAEAVVSLGTDLYCIGENQDGSPRHPMSRGRNKVHSTEMLKPWRVAL